MKINIPLYLVSIFFCSLIACNDTAQTLVEKTEEVSLEDTMTNDWPWVEPNCSVDIKSKACDFRLLDQNGEYIYLSDYYGKYILLDFSAMWCGPCQSAAKTSQVTQDYWTTGGQDFVYITVLIEDLNKNDPDIYDLADWTSTFEITTAPVLAGKRELLLQSSGGSWPLASWPTFYYISPNGTVEYYHGGYSEEYLEYNLKILMNLQEK